MFLKILQAYVEMCAKKFLINLSKFQEKEIIEYILKSHQLVLVFIRCYLYFLNLFSIIFFQSHFCNLPYSDRLKIRNHLKIIDALLWFIDNLFYVIISTHKLGNENIHRIKNLENSSTSMKNDDYFEFLVIGSGPAGSVTAAKISEKHPGNVAILERGKHFSIPDSKHPEKNFQKNGETGEYRQLLVQK